MATGSATTIGTYNIRYDNPGDVENGNGWKERAPVIARLIEFHDFDILGTQEGYRHQLEDLLGMLPDYHCSAHGRDDGKQKGENIAIFYKKDKFRLMDSGCFWLSETPDKPSKGWDAALQRICGWAKFRDLSSGKTFFCFSVHFDHRGTEARSQSARLIVTMIKKIARGQPCFLTGDFNVDQTSESYRDLVESDLLADSFESAKFRYALNGTANNFNPNAKTESRIDHVFVTKQITVRKYGVLTDSYRSPKVGSAEGKQSGNFPVEVSFKDYQARLPSDHFPVLIEADL